MNAERIKTLRQHYELCKDWEHSPADRPLWDALPELLDAAERIAVYQEDMDSLQIDLAASQEREKRLREALEKMARHPVDLVAEIAKQALEGVDPRD